MQKWVHKHVISQGFTIVELLIVIVIIGILATIVIIAYGGITQRAHTAALQSDLEGAAKQLANDNTINGVYPATAAASNNGAGLSASPGTTYQYTYTSATNSYCLAGSNNGVNYYITNSNTTYQAGTCPLSDGALIQTITSANCPSSRIRAVDARDNHTYWVQQLADGKCWMLTNLAYAGGGTNTYGDVKTLTNGTGGSSTYTIPSYYIPTTGSNVTTDPTAPSTSTDGGTTNPQYGYFYNWCGAMGGQATAACLSGTTSPTPNTTITICPAGWRLPTGNGGELGALNTAVNGGSTSSDAGLRSTWLGQHGGYWNGGFLQAGSYGYYASSTQVVSGSWNYALALGNSGVYPTNTTYQTWGLAVRCVAN